MLIIIMITVILCFVFWFMCYLNTGTDDKNIKSYAGYPDKVQVLIMQNSELSKKIEKSNPLVSNSSMKAFLSNYFLFSIVLFALTFFFRTNSYFINFIYLSIMGQGLNLFDYLVIDLLWWRNTKRVRFTGIEAAPELYKDIGKHTASFIRGIFLFLMIAVMDGFILTVF